jgi:hypothetical protein
MVFNFRTGIFVTALNSRGEIEAAVEYDRHRVATAYIKSWFFIDFFSGIPFSLIDLAIGGGNSVDNAKSLKALRFLKLARLLKLGRLLKIQKILTSLDRETIDIIEDFFQVPSYLFFFFRLTPCSPPLLSISPGCRRTGTRSTHCSLWSWRCHLCAISWRVGG